ncbi:MAG: Smr/MutS family protein [Pseudomonadota bacterium]|nr:Smr/MutS family protein [Pseudomonadota bacterium]
MSRPPPSSDNDTSLFHEAIGAVRRIESDRVDIRATPPRPDPVQTRRDNQRVTEELLRPLPATLDPDAAEPLRYLKDGLHPRLLLKLGRGEYSVRDQIDLHQMTTEVARRAIQMFLNECLEADKLCVKIITGKGMRSKGDGPVLKGLTDRMLRQRNDVLAFRSARHNDGGSGAVIVLLRGRR